MAGISMWICILLICVFNILLESKLIFKMKCFLNSTTELKKKNPTFYSKYPLLTIGIVDLKCPIFTFVFKDNY